MHSMTGFGRGQAPVGDGQIVVEIKSVNHRFLEIRTKLPGELSRMELAVEKEIRARLRRGYCTVHLSVEHHHSGSFRLNAQKLTGYVQELREVERQTGIKAESLVAVLATAPDIFDFSLQSDEQTIHNACLTATIHAVEQLMEMRRAEGAHMTDDLQMRLQQIIGMVDRIAELAHEFEHAVYEKYRKRIVDILSEHQMPDEKRVETEAAIIAEKADITEEITRLRSHVEQMRHTFCADEPVGRRLDFLIQEMGREANTIASKSVLSEVTHTVVGIKGELEKIRELVQNVE